jgi:urease accessory protein
MTTAMNERADAWLLRLIWLASPALPVGGFSYSEGMESAIESGWVRDEAGVCAWLTDQLHLSLARCDLPVLAQSCRAWARADLAQLASLNGWHAATRETAELRLQSEQMGRSMLEWLRGRHPEDPRVRALAELAPSPAWPLAYALALDPCDDDARIREGLLAFAFGWAENLVQAALKAVPLGQSAGQRVLGALREQIPAAVDESLGAQPQAFTPMLAVLSSQHEAQYSRLFRS